jgi:hypothetical protein
MSLGTCALTLAGLLAGALAMAAEKPVDPCDYGAVGDGKADDTAAIQRALDASAGGPRVVVLRPGDYRLTSTLDIPAGVCLSGAMPRWEDSSTRLMIEEPGFAAVRLNHTANVRALCFSYPNNRDTDNPVEYPPAILLVGINPSVEQIVFDCAYVGVSTPPEGANVGQSLFRDLTGFVHRTGLRLDGIKDIARIQDVHWFVGGTGNASFYRRERVGFEFGAVDGIIMSRCFMIGGKTFVHQLPTTGAGGNVHSLGLHITQCWTEAVTYGFLIEGTCGLILSDTQIYVSDPTGAGIAMRMPHLYYHSTITNTQVRCDGSQAMGVEYSPSDDHNRNHLNLSHCQIVEAGTGVKLGPKARRVWVTENHITAAGPAIEIAEGADAFFIRDNIVRAAEVVVDHSSETAQKQISGNIRD